MKVVAHSAEIACLQIGRKLPPRSLDHRRQEAGDRQELRAFPGEAPFLGAAPAANLRPAIWTLAILARALFVARTPLLSDDVYRYLWDGRVQLNGINPYRYPPAAPELAHLRDGEIHAGINRPAKRTVYPPGAEPERDQAIADLVEREANPTLREAARATESATVLGHRVRVVQRGALVALKFQAALSPTRMIDDRYIDVGDLGRVMRTKLDADDEALALRIAETIYPGARDDLARMLDDLRNNRPVKI